VSDGGRQWIGSKDWIGATLKTSSVGGRQRIGSKVEHGATSKRSGVGEGNQDMKENFGLFFLQYSVKTSFEFACF